MSDNPFTTRKNEVPVCSSEISSAVCLLFKLFSFILKWCIIPFIPLFLLEPYPILFYGVLTGYIIFFLVLNRIKMHYPWTETIVFIAFFLFCVFLFKTLIDSGFIGEKGVVKTAVTFGNTQI